MRNGRSHGNTGFRGGMLRAAAKPPELQRRLRLLSALHPALVHEPFDPHLLPVAVTGWLDAVRALAAEASVAAVCEMLREQFTDEVSQVERDAADSRGWVLDMSIDEARGEYDGVLLQLRRRTLEEQIQALAAKGIADQGDKDSLQALQANLIALRKRN